MRYVFEEEVCHICLRHPDKCDCEECQKCGVIGDRNCHSDCDHPFQDDTIFKLVWEGVGVASLAEYMRAVDKYTSHSVFVRFHDGTTLHSSSLEDTRQAKKVPLYRRYAEIGVSGIAWDGTD